MSPVYLLQAVGLIRAHITDYVYKVRHAQVLHTPLVVAAPFSYVVYQLHSLHMPISLKKVQKNQFC